MNNRMNLVSKIIAAACALLLISVLVLPIWRIELSAPQYPEGLVLKIYASKLGGDVDIVNGLNHYIGMRTLHAKDFVEFTVLPYIIGTLAFFGLVSVLVNRKWFFLTWTAFFLLFAATAMIDFYRWEYNYGHNLDASAPIQVPGMSYQPPLIGYKQLLNFGAYSIPDSGGWVFIVVGVVLLLASFSEIRKWHKAKSGLLKMKVTAAVLCVMVLMGCSTGPQPIHFGTDACHYCKMTITDDRFGAEVVTKKGIAYKFDDIHCLTAFLQSGAIQAKEPAGIYLVDFSQKKNLFRAADCLLLKSEAIHAPMGGNLAAFSNKDSINKFKQQLNGNITSWHEIQH